MLVWLFLNEVPRGVLGTWRAFDGHLFNEGMRHGKWLVNCKILQAVRSGNDDG